jgi:hypothetical protein
VDCREATSGADTACALLIARAWTGGATGSLQQILQCLHVRDSIPAHQGVVAVLLRKRYEPSKDGSALTATEIAEESELRALISKKSAVLVSPPGYGPLDAMNDSDRLHQLNCKRLSPASCGGGELKGVDDEEEAFLTARVAAYRHSQEGRDRHRLVELDVYRQHRSKDEQAELDELRIIYPRATSESELTKAIQLRPAELRQSSN